MPSLSDAPRTLRAPRRDALRNDAIVIEAARAVFAEQGPQASMEAIATRAGLGVGTIYRRFAGKDALLDAIAQTFVDEMDRAAETAAADPDPAHGLERFLDFVGAFNAEKRRYAAALIDRVASDEVSARTADRVQQLTQAAVDAGALAPHVLARDIKALIVALRAVVAASPDGDNTAWRRFLHIHLTGLRTTR
ncbi:helix-turn-helix transcriptional regulator [Phycicoccus endophyticus]|uniref:Helix-turn-helix transcriptional regulator n=1 Tax=Phycicoccus endophyticus TaxID=1690220 RepID=A0A7G9R3B8_9MICO|nr:TetR/AcrR family transcriptional regulator [Phycicoccus endophyticus]NHI19841.1 helix-turn-helix transcriptional regulator [Phycicoccus endophyticus]QNN50093.1 helix-turn-helix transcriptional regulator [Phycicoccus endophyticus]GGL28134.1 TetR family transcriptional regulator [Phycicoccus endophyticus]